MYVYIYRERVYYIDTYIIYSVHYIMYIYKYIMYVLISYICIYIIAYVCISMYTYTYISMCIYIHMFEALVGLPIKNGRLYMVSPTKSVLNDDQSWMPSMCGLLLAKSTYPHYEMGLASPN